MYVAYDAIILYAIDLAPRIHHPRVVGCDDGNDVYALGLEIFDVLDVGGKVTSLAAGCECAWVASQLCS